MQTAADTLVIGAGPGGLACARKLAKKGREVLVLERKSVIGPKVCAGGITWSGLLRHVPEKLLEGAFPEQHIFTARRRILVREKQPIVATVNRQALGQWMAAAAVEAGAVIRTGVHVERIESDAVTVRSADGQRTEIKYRQLVGADGSGSPVRRFLNLPSEKMGIGINYQVPGRVADMEWHLNTGLFGSGYGWIFPHRESFSIGAYCDRNVMSAATLKNRLISWAGERGHDLRGLNSRAALVNYDYRGFRFDNILLVGDAAGLASGLTGEGIYPAIVSGEAVAETICDPAYPAEEINRMVTRQRRHGTIIRLAAKSPLLCSLLMEFLVTLLQLKLLNFHALEMADSTLT